MNAAPHSANQVMLECLNLDNPKSFFLFAGAGSGKTRSLVEVLNSFEATYATKLQQQGQKVAIITYTNAARDEIERRLQYSPTFIVSTIHSFAWSLIQPYTDSIRASIIHRLDAEIIELNAQQARGRSGTQAAADRDRKIQSKGRRLENLHSVKQFTYNPNGENVGKDALNHSEVIALTADFLENKNLMQNILIRSYPILLIDESQDTNKTLVNALFTVQRQHAESFSLGLFGDTMQRIYTDGEETLGQNIPDDWERPAKTINYRCPKRVIKLINKIREQVPYDGQQQENWVGSDEGVVRLFIVQCDNDLDKSLVEQSVKTQMSEISGDIAWKNDESSSVKTLCLEHKMSARRGGFFNFFDSLATIRSSYTGLLDGKMRGIPFFTQQVIPLIESFNKDNKFEVTRILRNYSPLLSKLALISNPTEQITLARESLESLSCLWETGPPKLIDIIKEINRSNLLILPEELALIASRTSEVSEEVDHETDQDDVKITAWENALQSDYSELVAYASYLTDKSNFGTHQGVKGLEFPRVIVVLDDRDAGGFLWSYEKLFGAKELTATDIRNQAAGKETSIDRTRRLFYVTCSRAEQSLAVIAYTENPESVKKNSLEFGWFEDHEIILIN